MTSKGLYKGARLLRLLKDARPRCRFRPWMALAATVLVLPVLVLSLLMTLAKRVGERLARFGYRESDLYDWWIEFCRPAREVKLRRRALLSRLPTHGDCDRCFLAGDPSCPFYGGFLEENRCAAPEIQQQDAKIRNLA